MLGSEYELANLGMQAIGSDHKMELALRSMSELDADDIFSFFEADDLVVEHHFRNGIDFFEQQA